MNSKNKSLKLSEKLKKSKTVLNSIKDQNKILSKKTAKKTIGNPSPQESNLDMTIMQYGTKLNIVEDTAKNTYSSH